MESDYKKAGKISWLMEPKQGKASTFKGYYKNTTFNSVV